MAPYDPIVEASAAAPYDAEGPVASPRFRRALPWMLPVAAMFVVAASALRVSASSSAVAQKGIVLAVSREDHAVGDYAGSGGTTLVYRRKKEGNVGGSNGYHIVTERLTEEKTRSELLEMRSKYKSDRHCA